MSHVFISYSKKDKIYARKLADHLISQGFDVWIDDRIDYGDTWERVIFKAIDDCLAFLVIMTPQSYESDWVLRECHHAGRRNKPPFPVLLEGEEFPRYGITQFVDVRGGRLPPNDFYERLEKAAPRKRDGGADMTDIPATAKTPDHVGITGDLEVKVIRPSKVQKAMSSSRNATKSAAIPGASEPISSRPSTAAPPRVAISNASRADSAAGLPFTRCNSIACRASFSK